jgi:hypothetical protein
VATTPRPAATSISRRSTRCRQLRMTSFIRRQGAELVAAGAGSPLGRWGTARPQSGSFVACRYRHREVTLPGTLRRRAAGSRSGRRLANRPAHGEVNGMSRRWLSPAPIVGFTVRRVHSSGDALWGWPARPC